MPTVMGNGTKLFYEREGVGPACMVLHGGLGVDLCRVSLAALSESLDVVWLDQRGDGRSARPPLSTITME